MVEGSQYRSVDFHPLLVYRCKLSLAPWFALNWLCCDCGPLEIHFESVKISLQSCTAMFRGLDLAASRRIYSTSHIVYA